ncbi:MAG: hypothetical protein BMS9Abin14_640 [Gammaproteobacteria bacterium]|nr:MAG: hypothetical protein BMS9Abin14_640 [Gammaproteobacteria bacterium]
MLRREVNPAIYSPREFLQRHEEEDSFVTTIMSDSKIFLKGSDSELKGFGLRKLSPTYPAATTLDHGDMTKAPPTLVPRLSSRTTRLGHANSAG